MKNQLITALLLMASSWVAGAQTWQPSPTKQLNMEAFPGGLSSVELLGTLRINRQCQGLVTLEKNGVVVKQIPASNKVAVYTYMENVKFNNDEPGNLHLTFWPELKSSPFLTTGVYKVTLPAGFFYLPDGSLNEEMTAEWGIDNALMVVTPATGSILSELKSVSIEFPDADMVEATGSVEIDFNPVSTVGSEDGDTPLPTMQVTPIINGTTVTVPMPGEYDRYIEEHGIGTVTLTYKAGLFEVYYNGSKTPSLNWLSSSKYTIAPVTDTPDGGYTIEPAQGEVYRFPSFLVCDGFTCDTGTSRQCYFLVYPPEGKQILQVSKANAYLYQVIDGERQKNPIKYFAGQKYNMMKDGAIMFYLAGQPYLESTIRLAPGNYQFVVSQNADYTNRNKELIFNYTVLPDPDIPPVTTVVTPAPEEAVSSLETITVAFPDAEAVTLRKGAYATITIGNIEYTANISLLKETSCPTLEILPYAPFKTDGVYEVSIPASDITVDDINYGIDLKYTVEDGDLWTYVERIEASSNVDIYSIDGRSVARNASFETVKTLNPGLYIVNGRKLIVR